MYIIDGHNLIPKIRGLSLEAQDDEAQLVALLQEFHRVQRKPVEVFFDDAPPGKAGMRAMGAIRAHFVAYDLEADEAIDVFLRGLGAQARNATVVTSDHKVQGYARERHAQVMTSEDFAALLAQTTEQARAAAALAAAQKAAEDAARKSAGAMQEFYDLFGLDSKQAEKPINLSGPSRLPQKRREANPYEGREDEGREGPHRPPKKPKERKHHGFERKK